MANNKNIRAPSASEARERGRKGGIASGAARRARKSLREELLALLDTPVKDANGNTHTSQEAMSLSLIRNAIKGNTKAYELIRDTIGEKPVDRITMAAPEASVMDEVEKALFGGDKH